MMIENRMVVRQMDDDLQQQKPKYYCTVCRQETNDGTRFPSGSFVCPDCFNDYLRRFSNRYVDEYIGSVPGNAARFFEKWWFDNLPQEMRVRILKNAFLRFENRPFFEKAEFCKEDDGFLDFVRDKLLGGAK